MQKKLYILVTLLLLQCSPFGGWGAFAQTYPVTISTQLTQPSPIYLSNYANTTSINSPIKVQLILNDLTIMNRQVRLKCYFQGAVSFVSNDFVVGAAPIYLEGGFPTQLTNAELGPYFEYQNLQGVNPNQYAQPLPEGIYTLSFEVYDFATNKKLSKKSSVTTIIFQNEPPFLNLPVNKAEIVEQNIQNIIFSWTPRSINVSNVEYEFSLVEIWNTNTPLQNAFACSQPLYTTTTRNTTVQYSITEPQLIPGKTYAWRVKAKALVGAEEIGVFKNNGYSEIFSFKYLTFCKAPLAITTTDVSQDQAKVTWSGEVDNYDYQINYREKNADSKWYPLVTPREYATISNLKPKTTYEYTVGAACDPGEYTHSNIQEFTTLAQDEIAFAGCGIKPDPAALSNKTPLPALFPNDVVTAGDFPIVVLKSTGSNGTFSGEGYVTLPFLEKFKELIDAADALGGDKVNIGKYSRIRITFNNIGINTDFKLISGEIVASYDKNWGGMVDGDKLVNDIMGDTGTVIPIDVQFEIKSVVKNPDGTLTITGTNGAVNIQPKTANDVIITDRNGNQYAVSPNAPAGEIKSTGKAAPGGVPTPQNTNGMGSGGNIKEISSPDVTITFAAGTGFYSLDENPNQDPKLKANTKLNSTYDIIPKKDGTSYYVHYKVNSDAPKAEDYITAKATFSNGKTTADIVFKTENGTEIKPVWSGNVATLPLKRTLDFAKESILATVKPPVQKDSVKVTAKYDIAGALNMWHVTGKKVNVTLVSLNGGETPTQSQAQEYLNSIYGKAGIQFEVSTTKVDIIDSWGASIETGDSDLLNTYTNGQQTITNDFQNQLGASYKNDTYYVLFTKAPSSKPGILGFMPLKRQFGFVFAPPSVNGGLRTLAHELGHGIFGLQHPFTEYNTTATTDLLMDYGTGTALNHNDWEIMHAPGLQLYQFTQGSIAGESRYNDGIDLLGNIITEVTFDDQKNNSILVGTVSRDLPYLRIGYFEYSKTDNSKPIHKYNAKVNRDKVDYIDTETGKLMPYPVVLLDKGSAKIEILNDNCTYSSANIYNWTKPENTSTQEVIAKIKLNNLVWTATKSLYKKDDSCGIINSLSSLIDNDDPKTCPPNIIAADVDKLNALFDKPKYTNEEVVQLIVDKYICLSALKQISWEKLSKAFKQLGSTEEYLWNRKEIALLRIMAGIKADNYSNFIDLLEGADKKNSLLLNLKDKLQDQNMNPFVGNNFTSFISGLCFIYNHDKTIEKRIKPIDNPDLLGQVISLDSYEFKMPSQGEVMDMLIIPLNKAKFEGKLNETSKKIEVNRYLYSIVNSITQTMPSVPTWAKDDHFDTVQLSPLDPIIIVTSNNLPLVETALIGLPTTQDKKYLVPAIFLEYKSQKEFDNLIEKGVLISLDVVTIASGTGTLFKATTWAQRIWAATEVTGAIGNIGLTTTTVDPESYFGKATNAYNLAMLGIGLKNGAIGLKNVVKNLPGQTKTLFESNSSLKSILISHYTNWKIATTNLENFSSTERQLILDQGKVFKRLELVNNVDNLLSIYPNISKFVQDIRVKVYFKNDLQLKSFEEILKTANPDVLKWIDRMTEGQIDDFAEMVRGFKDNPEKFKLSIKSIDDFVGTPSRPGFVKFWVLTPKMEDGLTTIRKLKEEGKLLPTGNATEIQLATAQNYTAWGNFLNNPMRYGEYFGAYAERALVHLKEGLAELRKVPERNMMNKNVFSGRGYSLDEFNDLFVGKKGEEVIINKGFISSSLDENVAVHFASKTSSATKNIKVIRRIKSKTGVYLDDLSDYGENLGKTRHSDSDAIEQLQREVLMEEGYFKQTSEPIPFTGSDGTKWYYIDFEEIGKPLN